MRRNHAVTSQRGPRHPARGVVSSYQLNQVEGSSTTYCLCFGDSGSPQLAQGTLLVLSVTSGGNGQCNANNQNYRVDTPQARAFLGQFLNLP